MDVVTTIFSGCNFNVFQLIRDLEIALKSEIKEYKFMAATHFCVISRFKAANLDF